MTIRHLKIFIEVYKEMSITKASQKLHLAQPGVSFAIRELEETYGIQLFDRIGRKLFVTETGKLFFSYASHIVESFEEMESVMTSPKSVGSIHIGSSITIGNYLIPEALQRFEKLYPNCRVYVSVQNSHQILQKVLKNELDFGVVEDKVQYEELVEIPFAQDRLYFICGGQHPLAKRMAEERQDAAALEEICSWPFFMREQGSAAREITESLLKSHQQKYEIRWESISNQAIIHALQKQPGISVLSGRLISREVEAGRLVILPFYPDVFKRQFSLVYHGQKYLNETVRTLMEVIQSEHGEGLDETGRRL